MTRLLPTALIVAFATCYSLKVAGNSGSHRCGGTGAFGERTIATSRCFPEAASTVNPVLSGSSQRGSTADVQISNAVGVMAHRGGIVWADYSTNQTWAACPTWGTENITLVLYPVAYTIATNCTIPSNVTLQFSNGSCLVPADGTTTTIKGYFTAPMSKIFCNAVAGEGAVMLASVDRSDEGGQALVDVYPEWWGAAAGDASGATNTAAIQASIVGAYGNNRDHSTPYFKYNRVLHFSTLYNINAELRVYHMVGFRWTGENQYNSGLRQRTCGLRIIDGQSVAYGRFEDLRFENGCNGSSGAALVDIDYSGARGADLRPQNITFSDDFFAGAGLTDVGVLIAKSGGKAQGDNIRCYNCYFSGFTGAGWQVGGNNTGRNAGRVYAQNAIKEQIVGGDIQACPLYGVAVYGGSIEVNGTSMENGTTAQTGADLYCEAPQDACLMRSVRSESLKLVWADNVHVEDSRTLNQAALFYNINGSTALAGTASGMNQLITGSWVGGDGKYYIVAVNGTYGGLGLTTATSGSATTLVNSGASWTVNAFVGMKASILSGTDQRFYGIITANTATTITFAAGLVTDYQNQTLLAPDNTSQFIVEPNWGTQFTSGTVTFALYDVDVIGPSNSTSIGFAVLDHVSAIGGHIKSAGLFRDVLVTRTDWENSALGHILDDTTIVTQNYQNVYINRTNHQGMALIPWSFRRNGSGATAYSDASQNNVGTQTIVWSHGQAGGGLALEDAWVGPNGFRLPTFTFANLPSVSPYNVNGTAVYCKDCNSTCTAGSSTGRTCFRENGAWTH